jgi:DNA recombination protein Rad52
MSSSASSMLLFANSASDDVWHSTEQAALHQKVNQLNGAAAGHDRSSKAPSAPCGVAAPCTRYLIHPGNGSVVLDANGQPLAVSRVLATKPLQSELSTRPGPGNKKLTYMSGESVTRLLNEIFGHDGWCMDVKGIEKVESVTHSSGKFQVAYMATVRITLLRPTIQQNRVDGGAAAPAYREDVGFGDSVDKLLATAVSHAVKGAVTDALKRAARHFGDRLGNALSDGQFSVKNAPVNLSHALCQLDQKVSERYSWALHEQQMRNKKMAGSFPGSMPSSATATPHNASRPPLMQQHQQQQQPQPPMRQPPPPMQQQPPRMQQPPPPTAMQQPPPMQQPPRPNQLAPPTSNNQHFQTNSPSALSSIPASSVTNVSGASLPRTSLPPGPAHIHTNRPNQDHVAIANGSGIGGASTNGASSPWQQPTPTAAPPAPPAAGPSHPGTSSASTTFPMSSPPASWNAARLQRPETSSGRTHGPPSASAEGACREPAVYRGNVATSSAQVLLPSKRPLEALDGNVGRGPGGAAAATTTTDTSPAHMQQQPTKQPQQHVKRFNPYQQSLSN